MIILIIMLVLLIFILVRLFSVFKVIKFGNLLLIDGTIKSGKSLLTIWLAIWKVKLYNLLHSKKKKIYIYSNIPLKCKYIPITLEMLERKERIINNSVVIFDEASLVADSMLYKDKDINETIQLFVKLFAHWSHGGTLIYNTQSFQDLHFDIKRCVSQYYTIINSRKGILFHMIELKKVLNVEEQKQISEDSIKIYVPKFIYKYYDRYCFSIFTDNMPINKNICKGGKNLKQKKLITFRKFNKL